MMRMLMQKGRIRRVVVYFQGLQTHTVNTKADTKRPKCHSLMQIIPSPWKKAKKLPMIGI